MKYFIGFLGLLNELYYIHTIRIKKHKNAMNSYEKISRLHCQVKQASGEAYK